MRTGIHLEDCLPEYLNQAKIPTEKIKNPLTDRPIKIKPTSPRKAVS